MGPPWKPKTERHPPIERAPFQNFLYDFLDLKLSLSCILKVALQVYISGSAWARLVTTWDWMANEPT